MQRAFARLLAEKNKFASLTNDARVTRRALTVDALSPFATAIRDAIALSKSISTLSIRDFVRQNFGAFDDIKSTLVGRNYKFLADAYDAQTKKLCFRLYNELNGAFSYTDTLKRELASCTRLFTEFSKGITFFEREHQPLRHPVYHRDASCGSKRLKATMKFAKTLYGPDPKLLIERCLIERQIYDELFTHMIGYQDAGHLTELYEMGRLFDPHFPHVLHVRTKFVYDHRPYEHVPTKLIITVEKTDRICTHEFEKTYVPESDTYDGIVNVTTRVRDCKQAIESVSYTQQTFKDEWQGLMEG